MALLWLLWQGHVTWQLQLTSDPMTFIGVGGSQCIPMKTNKAPTMTSVVNQAIIDLSIFVLALFSSHNGP